MARRFRRKNPGVEEIFLFFIVAGIGIYVLKEAADFLLSDAFITIGKTLIKAAIVIPLVCFGIVAVASLIYVLSHYYDERKVKLRREEIEKKIQEQKQREAADRQERAFRSRAIADLRRMDPEDFEHYVAALYKRQGYSAEVTQRSKDEGVDVILTDKLGRRTAIQVKRYRETGNIGRPIVQGFFGSYSTKYDAGIFVTTSDFTAEAITYAQENNIQLINGVGLSRLRDKFEPKDSQLTEALSIEQLVA